MTRMKGIDRQIINVTRQRIETVENTAMSVQRSETIYTIYITKNL